MQEVAPARISVVVPTHGRVELLREALASIRALEGPTLSLEILVCDNGKGEGAAPAREFGARYLVVDRPGAAAARNAGVSAATGEYLAFLDDDDVWLPGHLTQQIEMLRARPELAGVVGQTITTDDQRMPISAPWPAWHRDDDDFFLSFLAEYPQFGATVVRTSVRDSVGLLDEALLSDEDWDWHLRLALTHQLGFVATPAVLFRQRPTASFDDLQWLRLGFMQRVLVRTLSRAGRRRPSLQACFQLVLHHHRQYYQYFLESAVCHHADGEVGAAWRAAGYAFASSPVHAVLGLVRPRQMGHVLALLVFGRTAPQPTVHDEDHTPIVLAVADRAATSDEKAPAGYSGPSPSAAPAEEWAARKVAR